MESGIGIQFLARITLCLLLTGTVLHGKVINREEALRAAFPGAEVRSSMVFLTESEMKEISQSAGVPVSSAMVARYDAVSNGKAVGRAYLDTHIVRTKKESLLIILDNEGNVKRVEVVAFLEPPEYMPSELWYKQFQEKSLSEKLRLKRDIHPVTGATLSAQAATDAVRRVLAVDRLLHKKR